MPPSLSEQVGFTEADVIQFHSDNLHSYILGIFCHAIYTCVYFYAMYVIASSPKSSISRVRLVHIAILSVMWALATIRTAMTWSIIDETYIRHSETRESSFDFAILNDLSDFRGTVARIALAINVFIADCIMIWRCWIIYGRSWWVILFPLLCFAAETVTGVLYFVTEYSAGFSVGVDEMTWNIVYYSMTIATNSICTILIVVCLMRASGPSKRTYRGIIEILVESAMLYAVIFLIYIIILAHVYYDPNWTGNEHWYPAAMLSAITGISPTLIIARVAAGKALPDDSWSRRTTPGGAPNTGVLSVLRFQAVPMTQTSSGDIEGLSMLESRSSLSRIQENERGKSEATGSDSTVVS